VFSLLPTPRMQGVPAYPAYSVGLSPTIKTIVSVTTCTAAFRIMANLCTLSGSSDRGLYHCRAIVTTSYLSQCKFLPAFSRANIAFSVYSKPSR